MSSSHSSRGSCDFGSRIYLYGSFAGGFMTIVCTIAACRARRRLRSGYNPVASGNCGSLAKSASGAARVVLAFGIAQVAAGVLLRCKFFDAYRECCAHYDYHRGGGNAVMMTNDACLGFYWPYFAYAVIALGALWTVNGIVMLNSAAMLVSVTTLRQSQGREPLLETTERRRHGPPPLAAIVSAQIDRRGSRGISSSSASLLAMEEDDVSVPIAVAVPASEAASFTAWK